MRTPKRAGAVVCAALMAATGVLVAAPASAASSKPRPLIVFEGTPDQGSQVVVARPDGTHQRRLTRGRNLAEQPRWSPSGKRILYLRRTPSDRFDLMVMGARGRHKHQLLSGHGRQIGDMAWGPDGRIAVLIAQGGDEFADLYIYSLRTRGLTRLHALSVPDQDLATVDWSRDGKTIAFSAVDYTEDTSASNDHDLYLIRPDGTGLRQLTNNIARDEYLPRFSPNGRQLLYTLWTSGQCQSIVIAAADGTHPRTVRTGCSTAQASWSPNGRRILVQKADRRGAEVLWSMALDGSHRRFVTHGMNADWRPR